MGRAKINSHKGDGLYEVTYYRDNTKIDNATIQVNAEIANIDSALPELESEISYWSGIVSGDIAALDGLIDDYKTCVDGLEEGQNPEVECEIQHKNVTDATKVKIANEANYNLLLNQESRLWATRDKFSAELVRLQSVPSDEEIMDLWCVDLCSRPSSQPDTGDWENVGEVIADDTEVGIIEIFNYSTKEYGRWITPSSYSRSSAYVSATHGVSKPSLASNEYGFVYNYETRSTVLAQNPKYRIATVTDTDNNDSNNPFIKVDIKQTEDFDGISLNDGYDASLEDDEITIDYMNSTTQPLPASVFSIGDEVLIEFGERFATPKVIGFTSNPKAYAPIVGFLCANTTSGLMFTVTWNGSQWVESSETSTFIGSNFWNRFSDGAFITWSSDTTWVGGTTYNPEGKTIIGVSEPIRSWVTLGSYLSEDSTDLFIAGYDSDITTEPNNDWGLRLATIKYKFGTGTWHFVALSGDGGAGSYQIWTPKLTQNGEFLYLRSASGTNGDFTLYEYATQTGAIKPVYQTETYGIHDCEKYVALHQLSYEGIPAGFLYDKDGEPTIAERSSYKEKKTSQCGGSTSSYTFSMTGAEEEINWKQVTANVERSCTLNNDIYTWSIDYTQPYTWDIHPLSEQPWPVESRYERRTKYTGGSGVVESIASSIDVTIRWEIRDRYIISGYIFHESSSSNIGLVSFADCDTTSEYNCTPGVVFKRPITKDIEIQQLIRVAPNGQFIVQDSAGAFNNKIVGNTDPRGYFYADANIKILGFTSGYRKHGAG